MSSSSAMMMLSAFPLTLSFLLCTDRLLTLLFSSQVSPLQDFDAHRFRHPARALVRQRLHSPTAFAAGERHFKGPVRRLRRSRVPGLHECRHWAAADFLRVCDRIGFEKRRRGHQPSGDPGQRRQRTKVSRTQHNVLCFDVLGPQLFNNV